MGVFGYLENGILSQPLRVIRAGSARQRCVHQPEETHIMIYNDRGLSEEQRMMRDACRAFVNDFVTPFIRNNWQRE